MKYGQVLTFAAIFAVAAVAIGAYVALTWEDDDDGDNSSGIIITVNSVDFDMGEMMEEFEIRTITARNDVEYTGVSMSYMVNESGLENPGNYQYKISAADGYYRNVTWDDMLNGVLVEEETMSAFPMLPGKYRIRDVTSIEPVETDIISVNGRIFTWEQPFFIIDSVTLMDDQNNSYEGIPLTDLINLTDVEQPEDLSFRISADDGYSKTFTWDELSAGILNQYDKKSIFPDMEKSYWVKGIVSIEVV
ncbi:MAG: hypothetical protein ACMUIG_02235 [Thermoplasmatota archaeon]